MRESVKKCMALILAFLMCLSTIHMPTVYAEESPNREERVDDSVTAADGTILPSGYNPDADIPTSPIRSTSGYEASSWTASGTGFGSDDLFMMGGWLCDMAGEYAFL